MPNMPKPMRGYWWYLFFLFALAFIIISVIMLVRGEYDEDLFYQYVGGIVFGVLYIVAFFVLPPFLEKSRAKKFERMMAEYMKNMQTDDKK